LGYIWFQLLFKQTQKALEKGVPAMSNPLRSFGAVILMCAPLLLSIWDRIYGVAGIISSMAGFALGWGLWWILYIRKSKDGGVK
jgi:hypothetical protein